MKLTDADVFPIRFLTYCAEFFQAVPQNIQNDRQAERRRKLHLFLSSYYEIMNTNNAQRKLNEGTLDTHIKNWVKIDNDPLSAGIHFIEILLNAALIVNSASFTKTIALIDDYARKYEEVFKNDLLFAETIIASQKVKKTLLRLMKSSSANNNKTNIILLSGKNDNRDLYSFFMKKFLNEVGYTVRFDTENSEQATFPTIQYLHISGHGNGKYFDIDGDEEAGEVERVDELIKNLYNPEHISYASLLYCDAFKEIADLIKAKYKSDNVNYTTRTINLNAAFFYSIGYMYAALTPEGAKDNSELGEVFMSVIGSNENRIIQEGFISLNGNPINWDNKNPFIEQMRQVNLKTANML